MAFTAPVVLHHDGAGLASSSFNPLYVFIERIQTKLSVKHELTKLRIFNAMLFA
jgi:hypothetical protein